jgi:hypothetical protein
MLHEHCPNRQRLSVWNHILAEYSEREREHRFSFLWNALGVPLPTLLPFPCFVMLNPLDLHDCSITLWPSVCWPRRWKGAWIVWRDTATRAYKEPSLGTRDWASNWAARFGGGGSVGDMGEVIFPCRGGLPACSCFRVRKEKSDGDQ